MENTAKTYQTGDLYLAAFLKARGMRLKDKLKYGSKYVFVFDDCHDRKELIGEFFNDGTVSISAFKNALQDLKTLVYNV